jgi:hypothetical protein
LSQSHTNLRYLTMVFSFTSSESKWSEISYPESVSFLIKMFLATDYSCFFLAWIFQPPRNILRT